MNTNSTLKKLESEILEMESQMRQQIENADDTALNWKANAESWSVLECLEHLNRYSEYYLPALATALQKAPKAVQSDIKLHFLGRKSIEAVSLDHYKPQKTLKRMNPVSSKLDKSTLAAFMQHQQTLKGLVKQATTVNLNKKLVPVEFFKLLKLSIAETLIFMVEHEKRHMAQAMKALKESQSLVA